MNPEPIRESPVFWPPSGKLDFSGRFEAAVSGIPMLETALFFPFELTLRKYWKRRWPIFRASPSELSGEATGAIDVCGVCV